jgi:hypothetical protein
MPRENVFKVVILSMGFLVCFFHGVLFIGSIVNLPVSWFGLVYSSFGLFSGVLCFKFYREPQKAFLIPIFIVFLFVLYTLVTKVLALV